MAAWFNSEASAAGKNGVSLSAKEIFQLAKTGDALAQKAVERENYYLGLGIANLINLFMPEMIVLGGSVMKSMRIEDIAKVVSQGCRFVPFERTKLALASLGYDANLIGAAAVWHHRFGQIEI
jgi:glucokinase